jgi:RHS repeat-associated protein
MSESKYILRVISHIFSLGLVASLCLPSVVAAQEETKTFYLGHDRQGSLTIVIDGADNKVMLKQAWTAWGINSKGAESVRRKFIQGFPMRLGYRGHKYLMDADVVLVNDSRLYDPKLKRYLSPGGGISRFSYANNNPLN